MKNSLLLAFLVASSTSFGHLIENRSFTPTSKFELEITQMPIQMNIALNYALNEKVIIGIGRTLEILEIARISNPFLIQTGYYFSGTNESSAYTKSILLGELYAFDLGYRWSFNTWNIGISMTQEWGPNFSNLYRGSNLMVLPGLSLGMTL